MNLTLTAVSLAQVRAQKAKDRRVALTLAGICFACAVEKATRACGLCDRCAQKYAARAWARYVPKFRRYGRRKKQEAGSGEHKKI